MKQAPMSAEAIARMLARKHSEDIFVAECKNGPTHIANDMRRLDGWALKKTWQPVTMIGYEIKVSRSDFTSDTKWLSYLPLCHQFYWVCPSGLIKKEEVSNDAGLIWVTKTGTRLFTKVKAPYRRIEIPWELLVYVLMSRATIDVPSSGSGSSEYWRRWLESRERDRSLGWSVGKKIQELWHEVNEKNRDLGGENAALGEIKNRMMELGFDPERRVNSWEVRSALDKLSGAIPRDLANKLRHAATSASKAAEAIEDLEASKTTPSAHAQPKSPHG